MPMRRAEEKLDDPEEEDPEDAAIQRSPQVCAWGLEVLP